jgi:hypothetical protein
MFIICQLLSTKSTRIHQALVQEHECIRILNTMRWEISPNYIGKVFLMLGGKSITWYSVFVCFHVLAQWPDDDCNCGRNWLPDNKHSQLRQLCVKGSIVIGHLSVTPKGMLHIKIIWKISPNTWEKMGIQWISASALYRLQESLWFS